MVFTNFFFALGFVIITIVALTNKSETEARSFGFYAGSLVICALFSLKNRRHGIVGAAVLSLLSLFSSCSRLWDLVQTPDQPDNSAFLLNGVATILAAGYLFLTYLAWQKSKRRSFLAELEKDDNI